MQLKAMIQITLKISDKENGTPGEVCELIQKLIENIDDEHAGQRFEVEYAHAKTI